MLGAAEADAFGAHLDRFAGVFGREDVISIDGSTGEIIAGAVARIEPTLSGDFAKIMKWADKYRTIGVRTNADTPADAKRGREFGAEGIGLTRTEHMFFEGSRIKSMRKMILAETKDAREKALAELLPYQRDDFVGIFTAMKGLPVTIRLIDPPLHEFLPHDDKGQQEMAKALNTSVEKIKQRVSQLHEMNPMLGHRGCRLCVTYPEILKMQVTAITEATIECLRGKIKVSPEIMIPLVGTKKELAYLRELTEQTIQEVKLAEDYKPRLDIKIGTMIELPRAALVAGDIAEHAEFFSFGTNDLTQTTHGISRDDAEEKFLRRYVQQGIIAANPFETLDVKGVGRLMRIAVSEGRAARPHLKTGICGEHGGDPASIAFCHELGLDYVSCSPYRVPVARLAAAQAALAGTEKAGKQASGE